MESLHHDPLTHQPYDLTVHVPHIVPCCGETCAITTIHHAKSTVDKCPFCAKALPDAGWVVNKPICEMLSAQAQPHKPKGMSGKCLKTLRSHTGMVRCLQILPSGQLASGSQDNSIKIWDTTAATCLKIFQGHTESVLCLQILPSGQLASGSCDDTIKIWDSTASTCLKTFQGHTDSVLCLQMLPSGQLASGSEDYTIKIWDTTAATCLKTLKGHSNLVMCLQMLPLGQLASGSYEDKSIWCLVD